jgi:hypothetical protein
MLEAKSSIVMPQNSLRSSRTFNLVVGSLLARSRTRARQTVWYVPLDKKRCIAYGRPRRQKSTLRSMRQSEFRCRSSGPRGGRGGRKTQSSEEPLMDTRPPSRFGGPDVNEALNVRAKVRKRPSRNLNRSCCMEADSSTSNFESEAEVVQCSR